MLLLGKPVLDGDILSLNPSKLAQLLPERLHEDRATRSSASSRKPMRKIFPVCCASAEQQSAKSMAQSANEKILLLTTDH